MATLNIFLLIFIINMHYCSAWRPFHLRFDSVECLKKNEIIDFFNCSIVKVKSNQEGFNMNVRFGGDIVKPTLDLAVINERNNEANFVVINVTNIDGCQFLENRDTFNLLQIIRNEFAKSSNLPEKCPVKKDTIISANKLIMNPDSFPPYVPDAKFRVVVLLRENSNLILSLTVRGRVESKKRLVF